MIEDIPPVWELRRDDPRYRRAWREDRVRRGFCYRCNNKAIEGKRECRTCRAKNAASQSREEYKIAAHARAVRLKLRRYENGECVGCGKVLGQFDDPRYRHCRECREYWAQRGQAKRAMAKQEKRDACTRCLKRKADEGFKRCQPCRSIVTEESRRRKGKAKEPF